MCLLGGWRIYLYEFSLLKFVKIILWPHVWSILEKIPCSLEKNIYSAVPGWNALYVCYFQWVYSVQIYCFHAVLFCFYQKWGMVVSHCCVVAYFSLQFFHCLLRIFGYLMLGVYIFIIVISCLWIDHFIIT